MKYWFKRNFVNIAISGAIGIPLSIYAISQQPERILPDPNAQYIEYEAPTETEEQTEIKPQEIPTVQESIQVNTYFDVPLSHELQDFIFAECESHNIAPEIVISMIAQESNYKANTIGDGGNSIGLMQIQPKWHKQRMERLGCNDLLDPYQNIKTGIDILSELIQEDHELYWVLMAYNGGRSYANRRIESGNISNYALEVVERARQLTKFIEN